MPLRLDCLLLLAGAVAIRSPENGGMERETMGNAIQTLRAAAVVVAASLFIAACNQAKPADTAATEAAPTATAVDTAADASAMDSMAAPAADAPIAAPATEAMAAPAADPMAAPAMDVAATTAESVPAP